MWGLWNLSGEPQTVKLSIAGETYHWYTVHQVMTIRGNFGAVKITILPLNVLLCANKLSDRQLIGLKT